jgi:hypothetical protein
MQATGRASQGIVLPVAHGLRGDPSGLFWTVLLVGVATAALVQFGKDFLPWRFRRQRRWVREWIKRRWGQVPFAVVKALTPTTNEGTDQAAVSRARAQLERLAAADNPDDESLSTLAAYSLPVERLLGQLASVAEVVVAAPDKYPELFAVLAAGASETQSDVAEYVRLCKTRRPAPAGTTREMPVPDAIPAKPAMPSWGGIAKPTASAKFEEAERASVVQETQGSTQDEEIYGDLRSQFMIQAQRNLDNLQAEITARWRNNVILACAGVSLVVSVTIVWSLYQAGSAAGVTEVLLTVLLLTVAATAVAPIAHDLTRAIRSWSR